jgi:phosphinothricin acetyltransferase
VAPFPDFTCHGKSDRCWLDRGHGAIHFREALANSCNAYFLKLAGCVDAHALQLVAASYGIPPPGMNSAEARIGLGDGWKITPTALLRAYAELAARRTEPKVAEILAGLELAGVQGTASAMGRGVLAKTGTAACVARKRHAGDGFTVVLDPADSPRTALIIRIHGVPERKRPRLRRACCDVENRTMTLPDRYTSFDDARGERARGRVRFVHPQELEIRPTAGQVLEISSSTGTQVLEGARSLRITGPAKATGRRRSGCDLHPERAGKNPARVSRTLEVRARAGSLEGDRGNGSGDRRSRPLSERSTRRADRGAESAGNRDAIVSCRVLALDTADSIFATPRIASSCASPRRRIARLARAATATRGLALHYQGRAFAAFYSGNCGGRTQTPQDAGWGPEPYPYFAVECPVRGVVSGHRVGYCQRGAMEMARRGSLFRENSGALFSGDRNHRAGRAAMIARAATPTDAAAIARIYNQGIEDRVATFETRPRTAADVEAWFDGTHPILALEDDGDVIAFASTSTYRPRECYSGIAEVSVYVERITQTRSRPRSLTACSTRRARRDFTNWCRACFRKHRQPAHDRIAWIPARGNLRAARTTRWRVARRGDRRETAYCTAIVTPGWLAA